MKGLNECRHIGNLTSDPEVKETPNGVKVATFSIACNDRWTDKESGEVKEVVEYVRVVAWRGLAELAEKYLKKGDPVYVGSKCATRSWDGEDGKKRYATEFVANDLIMLKSKGTGTSPENLSGYEQNAGAPQSKKPPYPKRQVEEPISIEDIPF